MRYATPAAFRAALEARLNAAARARGLGSPSRLRKLVVVDRLLARLAAVAPDRWIVKGGLALDLRFRERARATKDLDLGWPDPVDITEAGLRAAAALDLGDGFAFAIERADDPLGDEEPVARYRVAAELAGRRFEAITLDVGQGDALPVAPDLIAALDLLGFPGVAGVPIPVLPLPDQVAEKLHAYTAVYAGGRPSSRVKDLVDLALIASIAELEAAPLGAALATTFARRATHPLPGAVPPPPAVWTVPYRRLAMGLDLDPELAAGHRLAAALLDPVLRGEATNGTRWLPAERRWSPPRPPD